MFTIFLIIAAVSDTSFKPSFNSLIASLTSFQNVEILSLIICHVFFSIYLIDISNAPYPSLFWDLIKHLSLIILDTA